MRDVDCLRSISCFWAFSVFLVLPFGVRTTHEAVEPIFLVRPKARRTNSRQTPRVARDRRRDDPVGLFVLKLYLRLGNAAMLDFVNPAKQRLGGRERQIAHHAQSRSDQSRRISVHNRTGRDVVGRRVEFALSHVPAHGWILVEHVVHANREAHCCGPSSSARRKAAHRR